MITAIKKFLQKQDTRPVEKSATEGYDIWSASYDNQPYNLMLHLDEIIFNKLISEIDLKNKFIVDIGCGTGRHWQKLYDTKPAQLTGFDVSDGMIKQLQLKFPDAQCFQVMDNRFQELADASADCIISTLTIAHIENIEEAIVAWTRILKTEGDLIITDFHPEMLAMGGKRSFTHKGKTLSVINYVHTLKELKFIFERLGFTICKLEEKFVNEDVKPFYEKQNAIPVYNRFKDMPIIYGMRLKKANAAQ